MKGARVVEVLAAVAMVAYPAVVFVAFTRLPPRAAAGAVLLVFLPAALWRLRRMKAASLRSLAALPLVTVVLLALSAGLRSSGLALLVPTFVNLGLLLTFAVTLRRGPPIIERFARLQVDDLSPAELAWCRAWTGIWCGFFALNGSLAAVLAFCAPLSWWTVYNAGVSYGVMGLLFAVEYVARKARFGRFADHLLDRALAGLVGPRGPR